MNSHSYLRQAIVAYATIVGIALGNALLLMGVAWIIKQIGRMTGT